MDFDDLDAPVKPRVSRFAPRSSKFKPKKEEPSLVPKSEPPPLPSAKTEPQEIDLTAPTPVKPEPNAAVKIDAESKIEGKVDSGNVDMEMTEAVDDSREVNPMDEDDEEDTVVREIDVYFSPSIDNDTKLYVMQYPLRPSWRPYDLDEQCEEVRLKPGTSEVEVDLSVDLESYNVEKATADKLKYTKQTLSTTWKPPPANGCAVGLLMGDKLHLHPIHAVVQLRPSRHYLDSGGSEKKNVATSNKQNKQTTPSMEQKSDGAPSIEQKSDSNQCWVPLEYHGFKSDISSRYFQQMVTHESSPINFEMSTYDYIATLCPGVSSNTLAKGPSKRHILSLPVEKRLQTLLIEGPPLHRFSAIKHFAPDYSDDELLSVLQKQAQLLRGYWVPRSSLLYPTGGIESLARNYILVRFHKSLTVKSDELRRLGGGELGNRMKHFVMQFALEKFDLKSKENYWKFKELPDESFIKEFPIVVKEQEVIFKILENEVTGIIGTLGGRKKLKSAITNSGVNNALVTSTNSDTRATSLGEDPPRSMTMSSETRHALPIALKKLFQTHKVCSFQLICQELRGLALAQTMLPKGGSKMSVDAANSLDVPQDELKAILGEVACDIHGCYVLKSAQNDPFRDVVIDMLRGSGPNGKLKKAEILEAARRKLGRDVPNNEYIKAVSELCVSKGSFWVLKSGDGSKQ